MPHEIITADIGGTHARFAIARTHAGETTELLHQKTLNTADYDGLQMAWEAYTDSLDCKLPADGSLAVAGPLGGDILRFTNNSWVIEPANIQSTLGLERCTLINDFGAIAHAVAQLGDAELIHCCGPDRSLPDVGTISIIGPGTGLGVAQLYRFDDGTYHVVETEGGHIDFAPLDSFEDQIVARLRERHKRVSVERIIAGPGLRAIYDTLAQIEGRTTYGLDDKALWTLALRGADSLAITALDRFCLSLGAFAGDLALAHGAGAVVLAGGLGGRIAHILPSSGFEQRFIAKGRYKEIMQKIPVKLLKHQQPGLLGAAAAFMKEHES